MTINRYQVQREKNMYAIIGNTFFSIQIRNYYVPTEKFSHFPPLSGGCSFGF